MGWGVGGSSAILNGVMSLSSPFGGPVSTIVGYCQKDTTMRGVLAQRNTKMWGKAPVEDYSKKVETGNTRMGAGLCFEKPRRLLEDEKEYGSTLYN